MQILLCTKCGKKINSISLEMSKPCSVAVLSMHLCLCIYKNQTYYALCSFLYNGDNQHYHFYYSGLPPLFLGNLDVGKFRGRLGKVAELCC